MTKTNTMYMETKICPNCKREFSKKPSELARCKFCSVSCRMQSVRKNRYTICKNCQKEFYPEKRKNRKDAQFCSRKCMGESYAVLDYRKSFLDQSSDFIDGFLLGDGHVSKKNCHISWSVKYQEFSDYIKNNLRDYNPNDSRRFQKDVRCKNGGYYTSRGNTKCHPDLVLQRARWYKDKKIVPRDVSLSPTSLMIWYLGDGTLTNYGVTLSTDNFKNDDVDFLITKLYQIGISSNRRSHVGAPVIAVNSAGRKVFFDYIGWTSPVKCYEYKFPKKKQYLVDDTYAHRDRGYSTNDRNMSKIG